MAEKSVTQPGSVFDPSLFIDTYDPAELYEARLEADIARTAESAVNGDYVLVIGSRGLMDVGRCGGIDDADAVMLSLTHALARNDNYPDSWFSDFNSLCFHLKDKAKSLFNNAFSRNRLTRPMINPGVVSLLESKAFRVVLTTSSSPIVEKIMTDVWGDSLRVRSISSKEMTDISLSDKVDGDKSLMPPTLYYIFGRPEATNNSFALNDNEKIEKMKVWLGSGAPVNILNYVRSKKLFAYGCKFDDWFFRFLWHTFRPSGDISKGDVALPFDIENSVEDMRLRDYLRSYNVHIVDEPEKYISRLADRITANMTEFTGRYGIEPDALHRHVFISYTHRDYVNAMRIYNRFVEEKIPVWLDHYKLGGGDEFDKEINEGIESCGVFLPLLTANVRSDSEKILAWKNDSSLPEPKENQSYYRVNEWTRGCDANAEWKVIPVATFGYDYTKDYHYRVVPEKMSNVTVFDWTKQPVSELVERIRKALKSRQS